MSPEEKRQVKKVTAALTEGDYIAQPAIQGGAWVFNRKTEQYFRDWRENRIIFTTLDAEKIARLYNEDL